MATIVAECPRCNAKRMTCDIVSDVYVRSRHHWMRLYEITAVCRRCKLPSLMKVELEQSLRKSEFEKSGMVSALNTDVGGIFRFAGYVTVADFGSREPPDDLPDQIKEVFEEGARCLAVGCANAAGAMFRLCLDLATKSKLPSEDAEGGPSAHERRNLAPRLKWLFDNLSLPEDLRDLSSAVKANGDDGVHDGTLTPHDAEDLFDFAYALLDRLYSQPARLRAAEIKREARKASAAAARG